MIDYGSMPTLRPRRDAFCLANRHRTKSLIDEGVCFRELSDSLDGTLAMTTSTFNDKHNRACDVVRQNGLLMSMPNDGCYVLIVDSFSYLDQQLVEREFFKIIIRQGTNVIWSYVNNDEGYAIVQRAMHQKQMSESNWRVREQLATLLIRFSRCSNNDNRFSWWRYPVTSHGRWSTHRLGSAFSEWMPLIFCRSGRETVDTYR